MAKRKLGFSVVVLMIAAITLISGTYAWFMVGGFASLFDIGFDVIEASGGLLLQGDAGTANNGVDAWGTKLDRDDFLINSFIVPGGKYRPVSSTNGTTFKAVSIKDDKFVNGGTVPTKTTATSPSDICFNDFTFRVKSTGDTIPGGDSFGAYVQINLTGDKLKDDGTKEEGTGAEVAARVAVTVGGTTTVYSVDGANYDAVTADIPDEVITDSDKNEIISSADSGYENAALVGTSTVALKDGENVLKIRLGDIPDSASAGKEVTVKIWLEGNDKDCVDFAENTIAGKSLASYVSFGVDA